MFSSTLIRREHEPAVDALMNLENRLDVARRINSITRGSYGPAEFGEPMAIGSPLSRIIIRCQCITG